MLDRLTRPWVLMLSRLEEVKDVLRARCRPKSEEMVIRISEGPIAADRHEARVPDLREDHGWHSFCVHPANPQGRARATRHTPSKACRPGGRSASSPTTRSAQLGALLMALSGAGASRELRQHLVAAITGLPVATTPRSVLRDWWTRQQT